MPVCKYVGFHDDAFTLNAFDCVTTIVDLRANSFQHNTSSSLLWNHAKPFSSKLTAKMGMAAGAPAHCRTPRRGILTR